MTNIQGRVFGIDHVLQRIYVCSIRFLQKYGTGIKELSARGQPMHQRALAAVIGEVAE